MGTNRAGAGEELRMGSWLLSNESNSGNEQKKGNENAPSSHFGTLLPPRSILSTTCISPSSSSSATALPSSVLLRNLGRPRSLSAGDGAVPVLGLASAGDEGCSPDVDGLLYLSSYQRIRSAQTIAQRHSHAPDPTAYMQTHPAGSH